MRISSICILAACLALFLIQAGDIQAQSGRPYKFFISPTLNFAVSPEDFTDYYIMGYGFSVGVEYPVFPSLPNWVLVGMFDVKLFKPAEGMIVDWKTKPERCPECTNMQIDEGGASAVTLALLSKGSLKNEFSRTYPYIKGGFGLTFAGANDVKVTWTNSNYDPSDPNYIATDEVGGFDDETNVSIILGFGLEHLIGNGNMALFGDIGLHMIVMEDDNLTAASIAIGIKL